MLRASPYTSSLERRCLSPEPIDLHVYFDDHSDICPFGVEGCQGSRFITCPHTPPLAPSSVMKSRRSVDRMAFAVPRQEIDDHNGLSRIESGARCNAGFWPG